MLKKVLDDVNFNDAHMGNDINSQLSKDLGMDIPIDGLTIDPRNGIITTPNIVILNEFINLIKSALEVDGSISIG